MEGILGLLIGLVAVVLIFSVPIIHIWISGQHKTLELKAKLANQSDSGLRAELDALREEVRMLRDTSMQYDLSFDTALQRMEARMEHVERRSIAAQTEDQAQIVRR